MGLLAYVGGVLTSFGGTTTQVATSDVETQDLLRRVLVELRVNNELLRSGLEQDIILDELREEVGDGS